MVTKIEVKGKGDVYDCQIILNDVNENIGQRKEHDQEMFVFDTGLDIDHIRKGIMTFCLSH
jgi:hypothetical protein